MTELDLDLKEKRAKLCVKGMFIMCVHFFSYITFLIQQSPELYMQLNNSKIKELFLFILHYFKTIGLKCRYFCTTICKLVFK